MRAISLLVVNRSKAQYCAIIVDLGTDFLTRNDCLLKNIVFYEQFERRSDEG